MSFGTVCPADAACVACAAAPRWGGRREGWGKSCRRTAGAVPRRLRGLLGGLEGRLAALCPWGRRGCIFAQPCWGPALPFPAALCPMLCPRSIPALTFSPRVLASLPRDEMQMRTSYSKSNGQPKSLSSATPGSGSVPVSSPTRGGVKKVSGVGGTTYEISV